MNNYNLKFLIIEDTSMTWRTKMDIYAICTYVDWNFFTSTAVQDYTKLDFAIRPLLKCDPNISWFEFYAE